jgi:peptidoglycan/LPS O-acetylase OafA/YrhL
MAARKYRPDIDGLRAIAVLAVVAFHVDFEMASGGFVGVDVFFVISGFLITGLLVEESAQSRALDFASFYSRRARRLFPALYATIAGSFVAAILLFSPRDLERVSGAVIFALTGLSNFYFWLESGYFDAQSDLKPLLHTWSLGVEEQFYLVWPALFLFLRAQRRRHLAPMLVFGIGAMSLLLNLLVLSVSGAQAGASWGRDIPSMVFFLTPFRLFEFAIGALLVWMHRAWPQSALVREASLLVGLVLIGIAIVAFDEETVFPSYNALLPCVGAALVLLAGNPPRSGRLLNNRLAVGVGLISYSLYLVHWPLIVFWKYYTVRELTGAEMVGLPLLAILLAILMYRFIEQPFRTRHGLFGSNRTFGLACAGLCLVLAAPAVNAWTDHGWSWRLPNELSQSIDEMRAKRAEYWESWAGNIKHPSEFSEDRTSVVVIGDSYALDVVNMLRDEEGFEVFYEGTTGHECRGFTLPVKGERDGPQMRREAELCATNRSKFAASYKRADVVVLADRLSTWHTSDGEATGELLSNVRMLRSAGFQGPIVIYGERPTYSVAVYQQVFRFGRLAGAGKVLRDFLRADVRTMRERTEQAARFYKTQGIDYFSPIDQLCGADWCSVVTPDGKQIYFDTGHFTWAGARHLAPEFSAHLRALRDSAGRPR